MHPSPLPIRAGLGEFAIPLLEDFLFPSVELVRRRDVPNRAVQTNRVVMLDITADDSPGIVQAQRRLRPDALAFEALVPAFQFAVALRIIR